MLKVKDLSVELTFLGKRPSSLRFKWLSAVITQFAIVKLGDWLKKISCQFFSQWEAKLQPITSCTRDFSDCFSDWFIALFAPFVIGWELLLCIVFFDTHLKTTPISLSSQIGHFHWTMTNSSNCSRNWTFFTFLTEYDFLIIFVWDFHALCLNFTFSCLFVYCVFFLSNRDEMVALVQLVSLGSLEKRWNIETVKYLRLVWELSSAMKKKSTATANWAY